MQDPTSLLALWQIAGLSAMILAVGLLMRLYKNRNKSNVLALGLLGFAIQSCSVASKDADPTPQTIYLSADSDVDLGEVVVIGHRDVQLPLALFFDLGYADQQGFGFVGGGGVGGGTSGGTSTGSGNSGSTGISSEPAADENNTNAPNGRIHVLRFDKGATLNHNVMIVVDKGQITEVKSYYDGLVTGGKYDQDIWTQVSAIGNVFTFQFVFHMNYNLFFEGIGDVSAGRPVLATVRFNSSTGVAGMSYSYPQ